MRRVALIAGIVGIVVTVWLVGKVQEWRRADELACRFAGTSSCEVASYAPAIFVGIMSVLLLVIAAWASRRQGVTQK